MAAEQRTHRRQEVGALPLMHALARRMGLRALLARFVPSHGNDQVPVADTLMLLIYNLTRAKEPLYQLPAWVGTIDGRAIGDPELVTKSFSDDRFGRALDRLYRADRAALMTELVLTVVQQFELDLSRLHNDSTSIKAYGNYRGKTPSGVQLARGHSKDHRADLKQLVFTLSLSADGAVPIHHQVYSGNRTDDTTHIETWRTLCKIAGTAQFLYVADSKLCTDEQLHYIVSHGGRAITIVPETWAEVAAFKAALRTGAKAKKEIWRRSKPNYEDKSEYFSVFTGKHLTQKRGYRLHWLYSSEKRKRDRDARAQRLARAEEALMTLNAKLNTRQLKEREAIEAAVAEVVERHQVNGLLQVEIGTARIGHRVQIGKGRPGKNTKYELRIQHIYTLTWNRQPQALKAEARVDGVFPLLSTDLELSSKEVLQAYKYQPRLERRFAQFKSIHRAAPLLFKKVIRIEANFFLFFIALMLQALLEREVRNTMAARRIESIPIYPEERGANRPTTSKILNLFERVSSYAIVEHGRVVEEFKDDLTQTQRDVLDCLAISEGDFWLVK